MSESGAVFVNQMQRSGQIGPLAAWITSAGWAAEAERRYGRAWMVTSEGVLDPATALDFATQPVRSADAIASWRRRIPEPAITFAKDVRRIAENRHFRARFADGPWCSADVRFVMAHHGVGWDAGLDLADEIGAPSVLVVDALQVEEARSWGVRRPGWTSATEHYGEYPQIRRADVVVCVSEEVRDAVRRHTGRSDGVVSIPNGVDTDRFFPAPADPELQSALGLEDRFVVGWIGSFRRFHGIDVLVEAAAIAQRDIPNLALLMVGDGLGRPALELHARKLAVPAVLPGTVTYAEMPDHIRLMDVAVAPASKWPEFHYSPVKLREYQACGRPVIAAAAGQMARSMHDGDDALLVEPGDPVALAAAIVATHADPAAAAARAARAHAEVVTSGTWASRLLALEAHLPSRAARASVSPAPPVP